eukprot:819818-Rhodomonas_salina.1
MLSLSKNPFTELCDGIGRLKVGSLSRGCVLIGTKDIRMVLPVHRGPSTARASAQGSHPRP